MGQAQMINFYKRLARTSTFYEIRFYHCLFVKNGSIFYFKMFRSQGSGQVLTRPDLRFDWIRYPRCERPQRILVRF